MRTVRPPTRAILFSLLLASACASPRVGDSHATAPAAADTTAAAGPDADAGPSPFDGCNAMYTTVIGWSFDCAGTSVLTREGEEPDMLLRAARTSMRGT